MNEINLIGGGRDRPVICLAAGASPIEEFAAQELQTYLQKITGHTLKIVWTDHPSGAHLFLGTREKFESYSSRGKARRLEKLQRPESFWMLQEDGHLGFIGEGPPGVLAAVYQFLERLGARWFEPGAAGEDLPRLPEVGMKSFDYKVEPMLEKRGLSHVSSREDIDWMGKNRLNYLLLSVDGLRRNWETVIEETARRGITLEILSESLSDWIDGDAGIWDDPECRALVNGLRAEAAGGRPPSFCPSQQKVREATARGMVKFLKTCPLARGIILRLNEDIKRCECANCMKYRGESRRITPRLRYLPSFAQEPPASLSDALWDILQSIRPIVRSAHPSCTLRAFGVDETISAPKPSKMDKDMGAVLLLDGRCYRHILNSPECLTNHNLWQPLESWLKRPRGSLLVYDSYEGPENRVGTLYPKVRLMGTEVLILCDLGIDGMVTEGRWGGSLNNALRLWIFARQCWAGEGSIDVLLDDFFQRYYGPAAAAMRAYFRFWYLRWLDFRACFLGQGMSDLPMNGFQEFDRAKALILEAFEKPGLDEITRLRIEQEIAFLENARHSWSFLANVEKSLLDSD